MISMKVHQGSKWTNFHILKVDIIVFINIHVLLLYVFVVRKKYVLMLLLFTYEDEK